VFKSISTQAPIDRGRVRKFGRAPKQISALPAVKCIATSSAAKGKAKVGKVMHEFNEGTLSSRGGAKVTNRKQAVAVALNEARRSGARIPKKKSSGKS
jgi:hypothetical protein